jgi:MFS family permease
MNQHKQRGWFIVATLFLALFLINGGAFGTIGVFVPALLKAFPDWSRAKVSLLPSIAAFSAGATGFPVGWLLDRIEARIVMTFGAIGAGGALLIASLAHSFAPLIAAYLLLGIGLAAATVPPTTFVIANWFEACRGIAMGIAFFGLSVGVMVATPLSNYVIETRGWRAAYVVFGVPIILLLIPAIILVVRSRPPGTEKMTVAQGANLLEGFEILEGIRTRSFWMLVVANLCWAVASGGILVHLFAYLLGTGYKANTAALAMSILFGLSAFGKLGMGYIADRISARLALGFNFAAGVLAFVLVLSVARVFSLVLFILIAGVAINGPVVLLPLLLAESLGRRRYGVLSALTGIATTFGLAVGPVVAGRIFDMTGSYAGAFELFVISNAIGAAAAFACQPYVETVQSNLAPARTSA